MRHPVLRSISLSAALALLCAPAVRAQTVFVPPSDPVGMVWTTNSNDIWSGGRGVVFTPTANFDLTSVGLFQDLTNITLNYSLRLATNTTGNVGGGGLLESGSALVSTAGLEFIDFAFSQLTLVAGTYYLLEFSFAGNSNQNFFFDQRGAEPYAQAGFAGIDGTAGGNTGNFVLPQMRLNGGTEVVPEPATMTLLATGLAGMAAARRKKRNA